MSQTNADSDSEEALDQTFTVEIEGHDGSPAETELRLRVDEDAEPNMDGDIDVTVHTSGRHLTGTFKTQDPQGGLARSDGRHIVEFDTALRQFRTRFGDFIMRGATAVIIPDDVGDRIRDAFDQPTLQERRTEAADRALKGQLRGRMEHDDEFREFVEDLLEHTE